MKDALRDDLARCLELIVRAAKAGYVPIWNVDPLMSFTAYALSVRVFNSDIDRLPALDTGEVMALQVLVGDKSALPHALGDFLIESGTEPEVGAERFKLFDRSMPLRIRRAFQQNGIDTFERLLSTERDQRGDHLVNPYYWRGFGKESLKRLVASLRAVGRQVPHHWTLT